MADNVNILDATDTATPIASDDVSGVQFQRVKLDLGGDGASVPVVGTFPVSDAGGSLTVDGAVTVSNLPAVQPVSDNGGSLTVDGTVAVSSLPAITGAVSVSNFPATQPVSGTVAVSNLPATQPVSGTVSVGNFPATQPVSGSVSVSNFPATQPVSLASLPLPAGAATDATLAALQGELDAIEAKLPTLIDTIPGDSSLGQPVRQVPADLWRTSFADTGAGLLSPEMTQVQAGAGMTIAQSASNLTVATGTTANAQTLLRSVRTFRGAHILRAQVQLSQRIANQTFEVALADLIGTGLAYTINSATSVTVTFPATNPFTATSVGQSVNLGALSSVGIPGRYAIASVSGLTVTFTVAGWPASGSGALTLWGHNYHRIAYSGTGATSASYDAQRRGWASGDTTVTINTTAAPGHIVHLQGIGTASVVSDMLAASSAAYAATARGSRFANLPDDMTQMHVWINVLNGNTAPASTTTLTVGFLSGEMTGRNKVYVSGADQNGANMATGVQIMGGTTAVTGTVGVTGYPTAAASADALANPTVTKLDALGLLFNGATWDRARNNAAVAVETSAARTTTGVGTTQTNFNARGAFIWVNVTAVTGTTPTLTVRVQWSPDGGTNWLDLDTTNAQTASITATGASVLRIYPGLTTAANAALNSPLPRTWRLAWTITGTTPSFTFAAQATYVL